MRALFERHSHAVLQLSGKDSLVALHLLKDFWDKIELVWLNTGDAPAELTHWVRGTFAYFTANGGMKTTELASEQNNNIERFGFPSDVVPAKNTSAGRVSSPDEALIQPTFDCCARTAWLPMHEYTHACGATLIIRGQKKRDVFKSELTSGFTHAGVEYSFPVEDMSDEEIFSFIRDQNLSLPETYLFTSSGVDCKSCTGYTEEFNGRLAFLDDRYPETAQLVRGRLSMVASKTMAALIPIANLLNGE